MTAVRQIRKLDGLPEVKTVAGFVIDKDIPPPYSACPKGALREALAALQVGESLVHTNEGKDARSKTKRDHPSFGFACKDIGGGKFRIWRVK